MCLNEYQVLVFANLNKLRKLRILRAVYKSLIHINCPKYTLSVIRTYVCIQLIIVGILLGVFHFVFIFCIYTAWTLASWSKFHEIMQQNWNLPYIWCSKKAAICWSWKMYFLSSSILILSHQHHRSQIDKSTHVAAAPRIAGFNLWHLTYVNRIQHFWIPIFNAP